MVKITLLIYVVGIHRHPNFTQKIFMPKMLTLSILITFLKFPCNLVT